MAKRCRFSLVFTSVVLAVFLSVASSRAETEEGKHNPVPDRPKPGVEGRLEETPNGVDLIGKVRTGGPGATRTTDPGASAGRPAATAIADRGGGRPDAAPTPAANERPPAPRSAPTPAAADGPPSASTPVPDGSPPRQSWIPEPRAGQPTPRPGQNGVTLLPDGPGERVGPMPPPPLPGDERPSGGGGIDPHEVALDILAHVPLPQITVRMSPTLGLVALPSWYWIEGYDGQPFGESRTINIPPEVGPDVPDELVPANDPRRSGRSFTVEVRLEPSRYDWSFGDGATLSTGSLGKPYPAESDLKHTYEHSSLQYADGFPVRVTAEYAAAWRVDGGGWQGLRTVRRTYAGSFRVQEIQTVLVARP